MSFLSFKPLPQNQTRQKRPSDFAKNSFRNSLAISLSSFEDLENLETLDSGFSIRLLIADLHCDPAFGSSDSIPSCFASMFRYRSSERF